MGVVYAWLDNDGCPFYVGKSVNITKRNSYHTSQLRSKNSTRKYNKLRKLLREGYRWEILILSESDDENKLSEMERYWIQSYRDRGIDLCNHTDGGDGGNVFRYKTEEEMKIVRNNMRLAQILKNQLASPQQKEEWARSRIGLRRSEETRRKISRSKLGVLFSNEHKKNLSIARKARKTTLETRQKMSQSSKGKINTKNYKVISPNDQEYFTPNGLSVFCEQHGLIRSLMIKVANGERKHHKGWRCTRV